jgi:hypothetical protein
MYAIISRCFFAITNALPQQCGFDLDNLVLYFNTEYNPRGSQLNLEELGEPTSRRPY